MEIKEEIQRLEKEIQSLGKSPKLEGHPKLRAATDLLRGLSKEKDPEQVVSSINLAKRYIQKLKKK